MTLLEMRRLTASGRVPLHGRFQKDGQEARRASHSRAVHWRCDFTPSLAHHMRRSDLRYNHSSTREPRAITRNISRRGFPSSRTTRRPFSPPHRKPRKPQRFSPHFRSR
jgi:hypothetical protein